MDVFLETITPFFRIFAIGKFSQDAAAFSVTQTYAVVLIFTSGNPLKVQLLHF